MTQNVFIFMQFSGKIGQIIGWRHPLRGWCSPLRNPGSATVGIIIAKQTSVPALVLLNSSFSLQAILSDLPDTVGVTYLIKYTHSSKGS